MPKGGDPSLWLSKHVDLLEKGAAGHIDTTLTMCSLIQTELA
jgi:hypothetical protein